MQKLASTRRSIVNMIAFLVILAFMAALAGMGNLCVDHTRQRLHNTVRQMQAQPFARR